MSVIAKAFRRKQETSKNIDENYDPALLESVPLQERESGAIIGPSRRLLVVDYKSYKKMQDEIEREELDTRVQKATYGLHYQKKELKDIKLEINDLKGEIAKLKPEVTRLK